MVFNGLQRLTLLDYPGKVACTLFSGGCNFRCPFCHNAVLVLDPRSADEVTEDEIFSFLKKRSGVLDGVCVTGGEPLMSQEIVPFLVKLRKTGLCVKLDTNGSYPDRLREILLEKLVDYVAMDVKNSPAKYSMTAGIHGEVLDRVAKSRDLIMDSGTDYEFRTTVVNELHEVEDIAEAARWISGAKRYFLQNFVDSGELISGGLTACSLEKLEEMRKAANPFVESVGLRGV